MQVTVRPPSQAVEILAPISLDGIPYANDTFVGVAIANPTGSAQPYTLNLLTSSGQDSSTQAPDAIASLGQSAFLTRELNNVSSSTTTLWGSSSAQDLRSFFMVGRNAVDRLDGIGGRIVPSTFLALPGISQNPQGIVTYLFVFNPQPSTNADVQLTLHQANGDQVAGFQSTLAPHASLSGTLDSVLETPVDVTNGYLTIESQSPVVAFSYELTEKSFSSLLGQVPSDSAQLTAPHFFVSRDGSSWIQLVNFGDAEASVQVEARGDQGTEIGTGWLAIDPGHTATADLAELLNLDRSSMGPLETVTGYLRLTVQSVGFGGFPVPTLVSGTIHFAGPNYASTLPLIADGSTKSYILHVAQANPLGIFTGLAILNPGSGPAQVQLKAFDQAGVKTGEKAFSIPAGGRIVDLLATNTYFGPEFTQVGGHLEISSDLPVVPFALFGSYDLSYLAAIEAQPGP
jgi:hypothetical protein